MLQQRCNDCMTVQNEENTECEKCGRDDCLMYPISLQFDDLSDFTRGYITAMFWTECNEDSEPDLQEKGFSDLAVQTITAIIEDCAGFELRHTAALDQALEKYGYIREQAGHDLWLTRNGHGAGFWDRNIGDIGKVLTDSVGYGTKYPHKSLVMGNDGNLYLE